MAINPRLASLAGGSTSKRRRNQLWQLWLSWLASGQLMAKAGGALITNVSIWLHL